jgi:hypothetical protein
MSILLFLFCCNRLEFKKKKEIKRDEEGKNSYTNFSLWDGGFFFFWFGNNSIISDN